jgi:hypothetical protein
MLVRLTRPVVMRRIRALPSAVWIAAALVAFAAGVGGCGSGAAGSTVAARGVAGRYNDPAGWSIDYPSTMRVERSNSGAGLATFSEVTIANFIQQTAVRSGPTSSGFVLLGGLAVNAHGVIRSTKHVDICPSPDADTLAAVAGVRSPTRVIISTCVAIDSDLTQGWKCRANDGSSVRG